jgi:hypothetical protein
MKTSSNKTIMSAVGATGWGDPVDVQDWDKIGLYLAGDNTAVLTVKVAGSMQEVRPDFTSAATVSNPWDYVRVINYQDDTATDGDTGYVFAADVVEQFNVNVDNLRWLNVEVSAWTSGDVTAIASLAKNE